MKFETNQKTLRNLIDAMLRKNYPRPQFLQAIYGRKPRSIVDRHADAIVCMVADLICTTYRNYAGEDKTFSTYEAENVLAFACDLIRENDEENADEGNSINPYCEDVLPEDMEPVLLAVTEMLITTFNEQADFIGACSRGDEEVDKRWADQILAKETAGRQLINEMARAYPSKDKSTFGPIDKNGNFGIRDCMLVDRVLLRAAQHITVVHQGDSDLPQISHFRHVLLFAYDSLQKSSPATRLEMEAGHSERTMSLRHRRLLDQCVKNLIWTVHGERV